MQIASIYHKQMVEYGKHHLQAVCACASHLANRIYAVLKHQTPYELRDEQGQPITADQSRRLCLLYQVPDEVRQRHNKQIRRAQAETRTEARTQRHHKQG